MQLICLILAWMLCGNSIGCSTSLPAYSPLGGWALGTTKPSSARTWHDALNSSATTGRSSHAHHPTVARTTIPTSTLHTWHVKPCALTDIFPPNRLSLKFHKMATAFTTLPGDGQQTPIACASYS